MKTIQEYLKTCDRQSLVNAYVYQHAFYPLDMLAAKNNGLKISDRIKRIKKKLNKMIDKLIAIEPVPSDDRYIFLAHHIAESEFGDIAYCLYKESELAGDGFKISYGIEFTPFEEAVGFYVADTYLTQHEIEGLLVHFLYEVSWTGYDQEHMKTELDKLKKADEESKKHRDDPDYYKPIDEFFREMEKEFGFEFERKDKRQERAWKKLMKAQIEYNNYCQKIEIDKLKRLLAKEKENSNDRPAKRKRKQKIRHQKSKRRRR